MPLPRWVPFCTSAQLFWIIQFVANFVCIFVCIFLFQYIPCVVLHSAKRVHRTLIRIFLQYFFISVCFSLKLPQLRFTLFMRVCVCLRVRACVCVHEHVGVSVWMTVDDWVLLFVLYIWCALVLFVASMYHCMVIYIEMHWNYPNPFVTLWKYTGLGYSMGLEFVP